MSNWLNDLNTTIEGNELTKRKAQAMGRFLKSPRAASLFQQMSALQGSTVNVYPFTAGATLHFTVRVDKLEGFKDPRLAGILEMMEFWGPFESYTSDYPSSLNRDFSYAYREKVDQLTGHSMYTRVTVQAFVKSDSETCRKVVVGYTDATPQPIYKIECDDPQPVGLVETLEAVGLKPIVIDENTDFSELDELLRVKAKPEPVVVPPAPSVDDTKWGAQ